LTKERFREYNIVIVAMEVIMKTLAYILSGLSLLMSVLFLVRSPRPPFGFIAMLLKLAGGALSPYWAIMGIVGAVIGGIVHALRAIPMGHVGAGAMVWYVWRCTRDHEGLEDALGAGWSDRILPQQSRHMVQKRWT
jgi:hypothetical protein